MIFSINEIAPTIDELFVELDSWGLRKAFDFFDQWTNKPKREQGVISRSEVHPLTAHAMNFTVKRNAQPGEMRFYDSAGKLLGEIRNYSTST